jgi:hypothetical protein
MKQKIILGATLFFLYACGGSTEEQVSQANTETSTEVASEESGAVNEADYDHPEILGHEEYDPEKMKDWPARTYRSDGYRPSAASEWIKVIYTPDNEFINTVLYWNINDETPIVMELIESEFIEDEISGWSGKLKSPDGFFDYEFGIIEDRFNLIFDDEGRMQTFYQELE